MAGRYKTQIRVSLIVSSIFLFSTVIAATIIIATGHATFTAPGIPLSLIPQYVNHLGLHLNYSDIALGRAFLITGWISVLLTVTSTLLVWHATTEWKGVNLYKPPSDTSGGNVDVESNLKLKDEGFKSRLARAS